MSHVKNEKGGVIVFMTFMIVLLLIMVGMGLDTGYLTYTRSQGQAAVDAAALAAVSGLPLGPSEVNARVDLFNSTNNYTGSIANSNVITPSNITYVQYNDISGAITSLPNSTGANGVRVALEKTNPYTSTAANTEIKTPAFLTPLMKVFGASASGSNNVNVSAVAALKGIPGIPIAVMLSTCNGSTKSPPIDLKSQNAPGDNMCWTTYTDSPTSSSTVTALFNASHSCSGLATSDDLISINTDIYLQNGVSGIYPTAEDVLITKNRGKCWFVPVVPTVTTGGCNTTGPILDWAKICPTAIVNHGSYSTITSTVQCQQSLYSIDANLCFSPRLVREPGMGY